MKNTEGYKFFLHTRVFKVSLVAAPSKDLANKMLSDWYSGYHTGTIKEVVENTTVKIYGENVQVILENAQVYDKDTQYNHNNNNNN